MLTVRDLLKKKKDQGVWAVSPEISTIDAIRFMSEKNIGALLVLEAGMMVGIISERDFVHRIAQDRQCQLDQPIGDYMTDKVVTVRADQTLADCMMLMTDRHIRHLPVMDGDQLIGIISGRDVVRGIIEFQSDMIDNMEKYITGTGYGH